MKAGQRVAVGRIGSARQNRRAAYIAASHRFGTRACCITRLGKAPTAHKYGLDRAALKHGDDEHIVRRKHGVTIWARRRTLWPNKEPAKKPPPPKVRRAKTVVLEPKDAPST